MHLIKEQSQTRPVWNRNVQDGKRILCYRQHNTRLAFNKQQYNGCFLLIGISFRVQVCFTFTTLSFNSFTISVFWFSLTGVTYFHLYEISQGVESSLAFASSVQGIRNYGSHLPTKTATRGVFAVSRFRYLRFRANQEASYNEIVEIVAWEENTKSATINSIQQ